MSSDSPKSAFDPLGAENVGSPFKEEAFGD